jgi:hypothetical protein
MNFFITNAVRASDPTKKSLQIFNAIINLLLRLFLSLFNGLFNYHEEGQFDKQRSRDPG